MRIPKRGALAAAALSLVLGATHAEALFLWEVQGPKARHFLMGSVHMLPATAYPLPEALESAYAATERVVFEADLAALASPDLQGRMLGAARIDEPGGLRARIGADLYRKLQKRAESLGMPTPVCDAFRAWFCALTLELFAMQQQGFGTEFGLDQYFHERAREDGRPIAWLETGDRQLGLFIDMSDEMSREFLAATLDEVTEAGQSPAELHRIWRTGDVAKLNHVVRDMKKRYPDIYAWLLADRNHAWVPQLTETFAGDKPVLVVVGAAHLAGPDGLPALLGTKGLKLVRVNKPIAVTADRSPEPLVSEDAPPAD